MTARAVSVSLSLSCKVRFMGMSHTFGDNACTTCFVRCTVRPAGSKRVGSIYGSLYASISLRDRTLRECRLDDKDHTLDEVHVCDGKA